MTTKTKAREAAKRKANYHKVPYAVIRSRSKFEALELKYAQAQDFHIMEIIQPDKETPSNET